MHQQNTEVRGLNNDLINRVSDISALSASQIDDVAQKVGEAWGKEHKIQTNQIRNIFGYISSARNMYEGVKRGSKKNTLEDVKIIHAQSLD